MRPEERDELAGVTIARVVIERATARRNHRFMELEIEGEFDGSLIDRRQHDRIAR